jgi:peptidoglycan/LPS O-acetylase OafA/YrhL
MSVSLGVSREAEGLSTVSGFVTAPSQAGSEAKQPTASSRSERRRDIQGLRALAVILVIGDHAGLPGFSGGFVGVDVFFVISGYVITQLLLRETPKGVRRGLVDFYSRRIRRIVPAATVTLVLTMAAAELLLGPRMNPLLPGDVRWASLFAANFRLISTGSNYFVAGMHPSLVMHFWSLAVEEQFYIVWPVVVFSIARLVEPRFRHRALAVALTAGMAASVWWSIHLSARDPVASYYSPFTRFWELGLGCLLATAAGRQPVGSERIRRLAAGLGVTLLVVALATLNSASIYPGWRAWLPCGATAALIWAGAGSGRPAVSRLLSTRPLGYMGDISYSLYLAHYPLLELAKEAPSWLSSVDWRLLAVGGTVLLAACSYRFLENPIRRWRNLDADRVAVGLLLAVCVAASWTASIVVG